MFFQNPHEAGTRLADIISESGRDLSGFEIVAFGRDSLLLADPIAERFGLPVQGAFVGEIGLGNGSYLTVTSFGNGRSHNGQACEEGGFGCHSTSDIMGYLSQSCVDKAEVAEDLYELTLELNAGRPVYAPTRVLIVISAEGDGHDLIAAIEALSMRGAQEVLVAMPVCEPWMATQINVECISVMGVSDWGVLPEHFSSIYGTMPVNALSLATMTALKFQPNPGLASVVFA